MSRGPIIAAERLSNAFEAASLAVDKADLAWLPIGPEPYSDAILEAHQAIENAIFRFVAIRVQLPWDAGYTDDIVWRERKEDSCRGIVWEVVQYRKFITEHDAQPVDTPDEQMAALARRFEPDRSPAALEVEASWAALADVASTLGADFVPAFVNGAPYLVVGYPERPADRPGAQFDTQTGKRWLNKYKGERHYCMTVCGSLCAFDSLDVRALEADGRVRTMPLKNDPEAKVALAEMEQLIALVPGYTGHCTVEVGGQPAIGIVLPVDANHFGLDAMAFMDEVGTDTAPGSARFILQQPLQALSSVWCQTLEMLAEAVRRGEVYQRDGEIFYVLAGDLKATLLPSGERLDHLVLDQACRTHVMGVHREKPGSQGMLLLNGVAERVIADPFKLMVSLSPEFLMLAEHTGRGDITKAGQGEPVEIALAPGKTRENALYLAEGSGLPGR